jgi:hypothetical protein
LDPRSTIIHGHFDVKKLSKKFWEIFLKRERKSLGGRSYPLLR